jgi:hypothetical protein
MLVAWPLRFQPSSLLFQQLLLPGFGQCWLGGNIFELASIREGRSTHEIQKLP